MRNIFLSPHFSLKEMTESQTAVKHGISNVPSKQETENLRRLCQGTLEPLREALGLPVIITSGYRCKALNDIISHHSNRSQHMKGMAADFYVGWSAPLGGRGQAVDNKPSSRERLIKAFRLILTSEEIDYDQLILYPTFIHVSHVSQSLNRHYIMTAEGNGKYRRVSREEALALN
jgi:hypothetical protein